MLRLAIASLCALALVAAGCGGDDDDRGGGGGGSGTPPPPPAVDLTVTVHPNGLGGIVRTREVLCERRGTVTRVCRGLTTGQLAPVPGERACTAIYGGPAVARVTGTIGGERVDARFNLEDGCEIARWKRNRGLLGPPQP
jgi:hypothetical protein